MNANVDLMEENVIQINRRIMINDDVSVKNVMNVKKNYVWNRTTSSCENIKYILLLIYYYLLLQVLLKIQ